MADAVQAVILAAGRGTRLQPVTLERSKAMVPVLGKPIVARIMELLVNCGVKDFILVRSPDDDEIVEYFEREWAFDGQVQFVVQPERLGMADALSRAASLITGDFVLSACDNLVSEEDIKLMLNIWKTAPEREGLLALMEVPREKISSVGIVEMDEERVRYIVEKPDPDRAPGNTASMPFYIFSQLILECLPMVSVSPRGEYELQDAIQMLIEKEHPVLGYHTSGRLTVTNPDDLLVLNRLYLAKNELKLHSKHKSIGSSSRLIPPLYIEADVVIGDGCEIGPNVYIEKGCTIGDDAKISESILLRGRVVPAGARVDKEVVS